MEKCHLDILLELKSISTKIVDLDNSLEINEINFLPSLIDNIIKSYNAGINLDYSAKILEYNKYVFYRIGSEKDIDYLELLLCSLRDDSDFNYLQYTLLILEKIKSPNQNQILYGNNPPYAIV